MSNFLEKVAGVQKDLFLSHPWSKDSRGREVHPRVVHLAKELTKKNICCWLDEKDLVGRVEPALQKGIRDCKFVAICVTQSYLDKVNSGDANDNCRKEFMYAVTNKKPDDIIVIFMDDDLNHKNWPANGDCTKLFHPKDVLYTVYYDDGDITRCVSDILRITDKNTIAEELSKHTCKDENCGACVEELFTCSYTSNSYCKRCCVKCRGCENYISCLYCVRMQDYEGEDGYPYCDQCGTDDIGYEEVLMGKAYCPDCLQEGSCAMCDGDGKEKMYCSDHLANRTCHICAEMLCEDHFKECGYCKHDVCEDHSSMCACRFTVFCEECQDKKYCEKCENHICDNCEHECDLVHGIEDLDISSTTSSTRNSRGLNTESTIISIARTLFQSSPGGITVKDVMNEMNTLPKSSQRTKETVRKYLNEYDGIRVEKRGTTNYYSF